MCGVNMCERCNVSCFFSGSFGVCVDMVVKDRHLRDL